MALCIDIITKHGLEIKNAYIRIDVLSGTKDDLNLRVRSYISGEEAKNGSAWLEENIYIFRPSVDTNSLNFIKQGYEYLKSLEEFEGAVDI